MSNSQWHDDQSVGERALREFAKTKYASLVETMERDFGVQLMQAWGMTEALGGSAATMKPGAAELPFEQRIDQRLKSGRALFGNRYRIVDDEGKELPHDGVAFGHFRVKAPWVSSAYFKGEGGDPLRDGWFPTGDVATIDADGYMQITDRSKDVIKSGGEWISSIDIENIAMAHPAVAMAACIGVFHPKWDERPIVCVVKKPGTEVTREELLAFYEGKTAKWQIPDDVVFVEAIPLGATGKMLKTKLREQLTGYKLPGL